MNVRHFTAGAALVALSSMAQAALTDLGNGTVYDSTQNITWLKDWNLNGLQDLATQKAWAENLNFAGSSDWVLPGARYLDLPGEFSNLFAEFGDLTSASLPFTNVQSGYYWSRTEYRPGSVFNMIFFPEIGAVTDDINYVPHYAVAMHLGNVAVVPEPHVYKLLLLGLGVMLVAVRRRLR